MLCQETKRPFLLHTRTWHREESPINHQEAKHLVHAVILVLKPRSQCVCCYKQYSCNSRVFDLSIPLLSPFMAHVSVFVLAAGVSVEIKDQVLTFTWIAFFFLNKGRVPGKSRVIFSTRFLLCWRGFNKTFCQHGEVI